MRLRADSVFISSVLLSLSLVALVPHNLRYAATWRLLVLQETPRFWAQNYLMPIGFASLAIVLVGLIVIWAGYSKRERWAWFVMFIVVWVFAFPVYVLPLLRQMIGATEPPDWSAWFWEAVKTPGVARDAAKGPLDFVLMAVALFLPIKSFFQTSSAARRVPSASATGESGAGGEEITNQRGSHGQ